MSEEATNKENQTLVDLSELSNIQFQTAWTPSSKFDTASSKNFKPRDGKKPFKKSFNKDSEKRASRFDKNSDSQKGKQFKKKPFNKKFTKGSDKKRINAPFNFTMDVQIFPEDAPFNKLSEIIKESKRTYQLFDIAQLILEKRERMVILAKNLPDSDKIVKPLFCAQPLNIPFEDEQSAKNAALNYYFEEMFVAEQIEAEPPKGSFTVVNKCNITGDFLGAPNWHKYNENVREYHKNKFPKMTFEAFSETIEAVKGEENINAWLEQMKTRTVYKLKDVAETEEAQVFETSDSAKAYIAQTKGEELVKVYEQVRMSASNIDKIPFGRIRRNIEETIRKEKRFPITTANNMRGKLRRGGFAVYKRGSKGYAFVSLIKRKFLFEGDVLADAPQKIFDFLLLNPAIKISEAPYKFLGIEQPANVASEATEIAPDNQEIKQEPAQVLPENLTDEQKQQLSAFFSELNWLISEGYVVEYSDTTLQANPYLPKPKDKSQPTQDAVEAVNDEPVAAPAPAPIEEESQQPASEEVIVEQSSEEAQPEPTVEPSQETVETETEEK